MTIYMKVTKDEYELPVALADSVGKLARLVGVDPNVIYTVLSRAKRKGYKSSYVKVEIDDMEEEDV